MDAMLRRVTFGLVLGGLLSSGATALAQTPPADRWSAWIGCWRLITEVGELSPGEAPPSVCVTAAPGGARFITTVAGKPVVEQIIVADGSDRPVDDAGCRGTQRHEWSAAGGPRLYSSAQLTCAGDPAPRRVSGFGLLVQNGTWLDIQTVDINGRDSVRVRRYTRANASTARQLAPGRALDVNDVKEAASRVSAPALEAAIVESGAKIPLSTRVLLDLEQAKVPGRIIDVMVAVAYPEKFVVERGGGYDRASAYMFGSPWAPFGWYDYGSPFYYNPYYFTPFAYSYYGRYDPYFGSGVVVVNGVDGSGRPGDARPVPSGAGRVIDGQGYTRVRSRDSQPEQAAGTRTVTSTGSSTSTASPAPAASSSSSSSSSGSSSSGGSAATSSGFTSGGGSSDSGRTAVPR